MRISNSANVIQTRTSYTNINRLKFTFDNLIVRPLTSHLDTHLTNETTEKASKTIQNTHSFLFFTHKTFIKAFQLTF